jgi:hypothetical protein
MWWDFFKVFTYAFTEDPLSEKNKNSLTGAGVSQLDAIPDLRSGNEGSIGGGTSIRLRDTNDFVDLSTVTNRIHRYKEYERLRNMPEIEMAMTVFADETCLSGDTRVSTPQGMRTLKDLAENEKERFLVYCYDFDKQDYTLGWAHSARKTKTAKTIKIIFDNGDHVVCTPDHRILNANADWVLAGSLKTGDELMPFYRIEANPDLSNSKVNQFPRIYSTVHGWVHERQFIDQWRTGKIPEELKTLNRYCRMIADGLNIRQIKKITHNQFKTVRDRLAKHGFSNKELKWLGTKSKTRRVVSVFDYKEMDVYDLSVDEHKNFATEWGIVHNCQRDDSGRAFQIHTKNSDAKEELEFLFFHKKMLNFDQKRIWNLAKLLFIYGDFFYEVIINPENPSEGIYNLIPLPADSMYRLETTKGKLLEFQQSKEGPDYQSLANVDITQATDADLQQSTAIRFAPEQIIHIRIGDDRKTFYPYGVSLMEAARGPAHQLRLMEDAMVVYRLSRSPERRVFYIDVQQLPPYKAEAFIERMKDQFRKKKVPSSGRAPGASSVEERWQTPAIDEDFWIPIRPNANTRVETLPGASNLGEIDDALYFRNKLFTALNFPRNYFNNEDVNSTRIALSAQDVKFARMIERLQSHIEDALWEVCNRHLRLQGYPEESYDDLAVKMTPPSDWRELTRAEVVTNRLNNASNLKSAMLLSDYDILTKWLKYGEEEAKEMIARLKIQKLDDLKLQIVAQNPTLLGVGLPNPNEPEIGTDPGGPNPMLAPDAGQQMPPDAGQQMPPDAGQQMPPDAGQPALGMKKFMNTDQQVPKSGSGMAIPDASEEDIQKYNLDIKDFEKEMDEEEVDMSENL